MKPAPTTPFARRIARPAALTAALALSTWTGVEHVMDLGRDYDVPLTTSLPGGLGLGALLLYLFSGLVTDLLPADRRRSCGTTELPSDTQTTSTSS